MLPDSAPEKINSGVAITLLARSQSKNKKLPSPPAFGPAGPPCHHLPLGGSGGRLQSKKTKSCHHPPLSGLLGCPAITSRWAARQPAREQKKTCHHPPLLANFLTTSRNHPAITLRFRPTSSGPPETPLPSPWLLFQHIWPRAKKQKLPSRAMARWQLCAAVIHP